MRAPRWVLRETVVSLHERLLAEFGGASGLRDETMLDSTLTRPTNLFSYEQAPLHKLAASYSFGLVRNHPFFDGNKRIGFATAALFLQINGREFSAPEVEAVIQTLGLGAGEISEARLRKVARTE